jgi:bifunctional UDP-N-acetylglucosamine pyrophosphorylase/glucosamine-1-phosphate N-acetyltransferase
MLLEYHRQHAADMTILTANLADPSGYGRIVRSSSGAVSGIVEHRDASPAELCISEINSGIYAFRAAALCSALASLDNRNAQGEVYLTDTVAILARSGAVVRGIPTDDPDELLGINTREQLAHAGRVLVRRKLGALMTAGVTIESPESTWIEDFVEIGADTVVEPFVHIGGATRIGRDCRIGAGSVLRDAQIEDGSDLPPGTRRIGPLAAEER